MNPDEPTPPAHLDSAIEATGLSWPVKNGSTDLSSPSCLLKYHLLHSTTLGRDSYVQILEPGKIVGVSLTTLLFQDQAGIHVLAPHGPWFQMLPDDFRRTLSEGVTVKVEYNAVLIFIQARVGSGCFEMNASASVTGIIRISGIYSVRISFGVSIRYKAQMHHPKYLK